MQILTSYDTDNFKLSYYSKIRAIKRLVYPIIKEILASLDKSSPIPIEEILSHKTILQVEITAALLTQKLLQYSRRYKSVQDLSDKIIEDISSVKKGQ